MERREVEEGMEGIGAEQAMDGDPDMIEDDAVVQGNAIEEEVIAPVAIVEWGWGFISPLLVIAFGLWSTINKFFAWMLNNPIERLKDHPERGQWVLSKALENAVIRQDLEPDISAGRIGSHNIIKENRWIQMYKKLDQELTNVPSVISLLKKSIMESWQTMPRSFEHELDSWRCMVGECDPSHRGPGLFFDSGCPQNWFVCSTCAERLFSNGIRNCSICRGGHLFFPSNLCVIVSSSGLRSALRDRDLEEMFNQARITFRNSRIREFNARRAINRMRAEAYRAVMVADEALHFLTEANDGLLQAIDRSARVILPNLNLPNDGIMEAIQAINGNFQRARNDWEFMMWENDNASDDADSHTTSEASDDDNDYDSIFGVRP